MRTIGAFLLSIVLGLVCAPALSPADVIVAGPFLDLDSELISTRQVTIPTVAKFTYKVQVEGVGVMLVFSWSDEETVIVTSKKQVFVPSFAGIGIVGDSLASNVQLTDILAVNAGGTLGGPDGDVPQLTGFNTANP